MTLEIDLAAQGECDADGIVLLADVSDRGSVDWDGAVLPCGNTVSAREFEAEYPLLAPLSRYETIARDMAESERDWQQQTSWEDYRL